MEMKRFVLVVAIMVVSTNLVAAFAGSRNDIKKDTVACTSVVELTTNKSGKEVFCIDGKKNVNSDKKNIEAYKAGKKNMFIVFNNYPNGERKISKMIVK